jgi:GNAT superfamily N-acetyltransferase
MTATSLDTFLPGRLTLSPGTPRDYAALERFHYLPARPATWAAVWVIRYTDAAPPVAHPFRGGGANENLDTIQCAPPPLKRRATWSAGETPAPQGARLAAVAVLSYPTLNSAARDRALGLLALPPARKLALVNRQIRTISRVVVHPQFRALGLASRLVAHVCHQCPTRWVEAFALMGRVHPFFEKGGMQRFDPPAANAPVYYLFDRNE